MTYDMEAKWHTQIKLKHFMQYSNTKRKCLGTQSLKSNHLRVLLKLFDIASEFFVEIFTLNSIF